MKKIAVALLFFATASVAWAQAATRSADIARIQSASTILAQIMGAPDSAIPDAIMSGAKCIAIVPSDLKAGFIFGANYGKGVASCRTGTGWSAPVFFMMTGGSFGFQIGGQASDLVLIIRTSDGMQHLLQSKFKLGADASAAGGPVGRDAQAATDLTMRAQILTYSRSRGLFAGVSLGGSVVRQDTGDTKAFYGKDYTFYSILNGEVPPPPDAQNFVKTVEHYAPTRRAGLNPAPISSAAPATAVAPSAVPAAAVPAAPTAPSTTAAPSESDNPAPTEAPVPETNEPTAPSASPASSTNR